MGIWFARTVVRPHDFSRNHKTRKGQTTELPTSALPGAVHSNGVLSEPELHVAGQGLRALIASLQVLAGVQAGPLYGRKGT